MNKWKIDIILNSGKELTVYYKGYEDSSGKVADKISVGNLNTINGFSNENGTQNIFVRIGEIAVAAISIV